MDHGYDPSDFGPFLPHCVCVLARFMALYSKANARLQRCQSHFESSPYTDDGVLQSKYGQSDDYFNINDRWPDTGPYQCPILLALLVPFFLQGS